MRILLLAEHGKERTQLEDKVLFLPCSILSFQAFITVCLTLVNIFSAIALS